jgi:hypothetical protein
MRQRGDPAVANLAVSLPFYESPCGCTVKAAEAAASKPSLSKQKHELLRLSRDSKGAEFCVFVTNFSDFLILR